MSSRDASGFFMSETTELTRRSAMPRGRRVAPNCHAAAEGITRCGWCAYETEASGNDIAPETPAATVTVMTARGERQLCAEHARRGTWERRARRVSRVA